MLKNVLFIRRIASLNHIIKTKNAPLISSPNSRKYMSLCPCAHLCVAPWGGNSKAIPFHYTDQSGWRDLWTHVWGWMSQKAKGEKNKKNNNNDFLIVSRLVSAKQGCQQTGSVSVPLFTFPPSGPEKVAWIKDEGGDEINQRLSVREIGVDRVGRRSALD